MARRTGRAGPAVSSFGISGTNAHVILEGTRRRPEPAARAAGGAAGVAGVRRSAGDALRAQAARLRAYAERLSPAEELAACRARCWRGRAAVRAPRGGRGPGPGRAAARAWPRWPTGAPHRRSRPGRRGRRGPAGVRLPRPGLAVGRHGRGPARRLAGLRASSWRAATAALAPHTDWSLLDVLRGADGAPGAGGLGRGPAGAVRGDGRRWPRCGARSACSPPRWSATRRARSPRPASPARCRWTTPPGSSRCAAGR